MKLVTFSTPVDASNYVSGGNTGATGASLHSIDYDANTYTFQVANPDGSLNPQVNGVNVTSASETTAAADIRAAIAATIP